MDMKDTLRQLMLIPGPSGYEQEVAYRMQSMFEPYCDSVRIDKVGNCIGYIKGTDGENRPRVMVFGHMDSLALIVRRVDDMGFIHVDRLGGIQEKALPALRVLVRDEDGGWHPGVIGTKSHHITPPEEKYKVDLVTSVRIDIGAKDAEEVHRMGIHVGCPIVFAPWFESLAGTRVSGTAVDNRGACATLVGIAALLKEERPPCDVYLVGTVWEEFNLRGAMMAARTIRPDIGIMLDVTLAGDTNDLCNHYEDVLGKGPCAELYSFHGRGTLNGTLPHEPLFKLCKRAAQEEGIPLQRFAGLGIVSDAAYLQLEQDGVACLEMGFPTRYTHTPIEVCDLEDLVGLSNLVAAMLRRIEADFHLGRY